MSEHSLSDLDRCLHGRHAIDPCLDCPDGWSMGNGYLVNGQRLGTDLYGRPIMVGHVNGPVRPGGTLVEVDHEWDRATERLVERLPDA